MMCEEPRATPGRVRPQKRDRLSTTTRKTGLRFGYASQNLTLPATTGRTMRLANVPDADRMRAVVEANLRDLEAILRWNRAHAMGLFRLSQQLIPFASHSDFPYDWQQEHGSELTRVGRLAADLEIRLSLHPGQFIQPGSPNADTSARSIAELRYVARLLTSLDARDGVIVLHVGGAYGDRPKAMHDFAAALACEAEILRYLALENDERVWPVRDVAEVASLLGVPVILDTLHHALNPGSLSLQDALDVALPTWRDRPKVHLSSQDPAKQAGAHAWGISPQDIDSLLAALNGRAVDVMVEAKGKDQAVEPLLTSARI
jgi:UV DNA damage endonuclease